MRVRRHLLEQVRLASTARAQLHHVVVALHERHHPQQQHVLGSRSVSAAGSKPTLRSSKSFHSSGVNCSRPRHRSSSTSRCESWIGRRLARRTADRCFPARWSRRSRAPPRRRSRPSASGRSRCTISGVDPHVVQPQARAASPRRVGLRIQPGVMMSMILMEPCLAGLGFEQLLLAGPHGAVGQLPLHYLQALLDFRLVGGGAVAPQQELDDVGGHRVQALRNCSSRSLRTI